MEPAEDSDGTNGRWRIARKVAPDRRISTVGPDPRHAHKTRPRQQDGYKAHIVTEPGTGLVTAAELAQASGPENSDGAAGARLTGMDPTTAGAGIQILADRPTVPGKCSPLSPAPPRSGAPAQRGDASSISTNTTRYWANIVNAP